MRTIIQYRICNQVRQIYISFYRIRYRISPQPGSSPWLKMNSDPNR
nr:MAG TPA: hypothetical protein [Caudoviricetes sp.]